jgi:hypothetical protein
VLDNIIYCRWVTHRCSHSCRACCYSTILVSCCRCYTHEQQMERVIQIPDVVVEDESPFRVVVR